MFLNHLGPHSPWSSFREMERTLDDLHQAFARGRVNHAATASCPLNVSGDERGLLVTCELPGVDPDSLNIEVHGDALSISGKRAAGEHQPAIAFSRTVRLPYRVAAESAVAHCRDGVLSLALQRPAAEQPRTIPVTIT